MFNASQASGNKPGPTQNMYTLFIPVNMDSIECTDGQLEKVSSHHNQHLFKVSRTVCQNRQQEMEMSVWKH